MQDEHASQQAIARINWHTEQLGGPLLLVVDNAEEAASHQEDARSFLDFIAQVSKEC
jgi:hypothetical protein